MTEGIVKDGDICGRGGVIAPLNYQCVADYETWAPERIMVIYAENSY